MRHHLISVISVIAAILLGSLAKPFSPRWHDMRIKHSWNAVPENWESLGNPLSGTTIDLYVALKAHRENALINTLHQVSDPNHPRYGKYLSDEQVAELVSPPPRTLEFVNSWLEYHGVPSSSVSMTHGGTTLTLSGVSIMQANALLGASYQLYRHVETNETVVRTVGYALPAALHRLVQTVVPTTCFSTPHTQWQSPRKRSGGATAGLKKPVSGEPVTVLSSRDDDDDDDDDTTPSFLRSLYKMTEYTPAAADRNALGIVGILNEYPSPEDLAIFLSDYRTDATAATFTVVQVNGGGYDPTNPADESNLDTQYTVAMTYPTPVIFYSVGRGPAGTTDWFVSWLRYILREDNIPQTISISYIMDERVIPQEYATYVCSQFGMLGALGVSVLIATGDDGVGKGDCVTNDGSVRFYTYFPATCPYVTAVGGTTGSEPEFAATVSGGGFSNIFKRPDYQEQAVTTFLQHLGNQYQGNYNATSRGIPDISAQALGYPVFIKGVEYLGRGTSASTPIVASVISLLNDYLISQGKVTLGFLNPWLYGPGKSGLTDITYGSNPGCNTDGFSAIEGWDPVTGFGTPDLQRMLSVLPDLTPQNVAVRAN
ncbi:subtilisin-like protein [Lactarius akahatsu]|uniref:tripeptidyl-peptidase II n=1 Tax=Lactarius akahatsu TaxID=416441 RepID=A0AAD4L9G1_9AGAM|nr:subtilisin-like protein [Lactarius akahatsu]